MWKPILHLFQRYATHGIFTRWSPSYEEEVARLNYSAADEVAAAAFRHLPPSNIDEPLHIADIGIGTGLLAQQIWEGVPCLIAGLDFSEDMMAICSQKDIAELLIKCDVGKDHWPLEEEGYDAVLSAGLHEYLTPAMLQHYLQQSYRILDKDGLLVFSYVPSEKAQHSYTLWNGRNGRFLRCDYDPALLEQSLAKAGFKLLEHKAAFKGSVFTDGSSFPYRLIAAQKI
jgi:predicted TPR repeat methyltransferase